MSLIEVSQITFGYQAEPIFKDLSMQVESNTFWAIVGPNGSGKSTFLNLLSGQLKPQHGTVQIEGKRVSEYNTRALARMLAMVRQEFVPAFEYTVREIVLMARYTRRSGLLFENAEDEAAVERALDATETLEFADRPLGSLSGGERQRVFIARALAQETPILLLDEPTSHLDLKHQIRIFDLLKQMQSEQGKTILLVTHDINLTAQYCDRVLMLGAKGEYFKGIPEQVLDLGRIESVFGVKGYHGCIGKERFFVPLGQFSKDRPENPL